MSTNLWRYFFEDDVKSFRQYLAHATYASGASKTGGNLSTAPSKIAGSPGTLSTSPRTALKSRKSSGNTQAGSGQKNLAGYILTRSDINAKDSFGRTLLHHAASSTNLRVIEYVTALLEVQFIDLYIQDSESGWTALHRALYFGNVAVAQALMIRDIKDATDYTTNTAHSHAGGLVKIKDHEGNSPFEVFGSTIAPRPLVSSTQRLSISGGDDEDGNSVDLNDEEGSREKHSRPFIDLGGDEVFAFGSNRNYSLGLGDQDDRQYPERITIQRPTHLLHRLHHDLKLSRLRSASGLDLTSSHSQILGGELPALVQNQPLHFQDVVMSKMHTAVLTDDPVSNLHICGFGTSGRLGTGDQATRFNFVCIEGGGLASRHVAALALGQDHTIAITSRGEVFTWGANQHSQLGYELPEVSVQEVPIQLLPRQLFGYIKREFIIGAAASSIHSAIFTTTALYTFGRNEGQLGLMDADARSLETQIVPRRIGVSILKAPIRMVSATERATSVLLENHDLIVFTHYGYTKVVFQLEGFTNYFISEGLTTRYNSEGLNAICKVTSGGNTICAMSTFGEVFTIDVPQKVDSVSISASTTNPTKARNALPPPTRVWSIKKAHTAAIDVAVGQDGSIILCTVAGTVWRKEKRAKIKSINSRDAARTKDYKFVRIPNLTRAVAVRSNAFGAFMAVRRDCDVTRGQIVADPQSLWDDLFGLLPFHELREDQNDAESLVPRPRFWTPAPKEYSPAQIKHAVLSSMDVEENFKTMMARHVPLRESQYDMWISSNMTDVQIPVHAFLLKARSSVIREALADFHTTYYFSVPDIVSVEYGPDGHVRAQFTGADFLTIMNLSLYLYTETIVDVWHYTSKRLQSAARFRQVRTELMKIAAHLQMPQLESAVRVMVDPAKTLHSDLETAILDVDFFSDADLMIELANDVEMSAHSVMLCARCPFFDGLFHGRAGGRWMTNRRDAAEGEDDFVRVDLKHMDAKTFRIVLRHVYADTGEDIFDSVITKDLDEFIDFLIDVMSAANELMLDRLAQICQKQLGRYVTTRNICQLLNTVAECSVNEFKHAALEYICLNLETMLEHRLLEELDEDLLIELDEVVRQNQLAFMPFARSGRTHDELIERHPQLIGQIEIARQRRIDSMRLRSRLNDRDDEDRPISAKSLRVGSWEGIASSPLAHRAGARTSQGEPSPSPSPAIYPKDDASHDLMFDMDEDSVVMERGLGLNLEPPNSRLGPGESLATSVELLSSSSLQSQDGMSDSKGAWGRQSTEMNTRLDFKDILSQASASRTPDQTGTLVARSPSSVRTQPKMSQKERKKMQKEQMQPKASGPNSSTRPFAAILQPTSPLVAPPWQTIEPRRATSSQQDRNFSTTPGGSPATPQFQERLPDPAKPAMTMRQTVAGTPSTAPNEGLKQTRSVSTPTPNPPLPPIQSIRHIPLPTRSSSSVDARTSMADILAQQQTEKIAVKEAVAKRSLQEIQQEQEFQQWWDAESRRVQDEEAKVDGARKGKGERGRGGSGGGKRRGGGRGGATAPAASSSEAPPASGNVTPGTSSRGSHRGRARAGARSVQ